MKRSKQWILLTALLAGSLGLLAYTVNWYRDGRERDRQREATVREWDVETGSGPREARTPHTPARPSTLDTTAPRVPVRRVELSPEARRSGETAEAYEMRQLMRARLLDWFDHYKLDEAQRQQVLDAIADAIVDLRETQYALATRNRLNGPEDEHDDRAIGAGLIGGPTSEALLDRVRTIAGAEAAEGFVLGAAVFQMMTSQLVEVEVE